MQRSGDGLRPSRIPAGGPVHPSITSAIDAARGGGRPLEGTARERLELKLGESLGDVRVHADAHAGALARAVSARAFTVGTDLFFAAGAYRPGSHDGDTLIAHEVMHAIQQRGAPASGPLSVSAPGAAAELEAEAMASTLQTEAPARPLRAANAGRRQPGRTAGSTQVTRGAVISIARTVDPTSDEYQRGYNDGRAANPAAPGPLSPDALDDYNAGYQNGQAEADAAQASLPPATPAPGSTSSPAPDSPQVPAPAAAPAADVSGAGGEELGGTPPSSGESSPSIAPMTSGGCTAAEVAALVTAMHSFCDQPRRCNMLTDTCATATAKVAAGYGCTSFRTLIQQKCFRPGDPRYEGHMEQLAQAYAALRNCQAVMSAKCAEEEAAAEEAAAEAEAEAEAAGTAETTEVVETTAAVAEGAEEGATLLEVLEIVGAILL